MNIDILRFIETRRDKPFEWGRHDCSTFAVEILDRLYPGNKFIRLAGRVSTKREALDFASVCKWEDELKAAFIIEEPKEKEAPDLLIFDLHGFECVHIKVKDKYYSVDIKQGIIDFPLIYAQIIPAKKYMIRGIK